MAALSRAQEGYIVRQVKVTGNRVATESLILGVSSIDVGSPLTPTAVAETIRRLYGLGIFRDVEVDAEQVSNGLDVTIVVSELPKLSGIEFKGNDKISEKDLRKTINLGVGGYISDYLIFQASTEIRKKYAKEGYFQAQVDGVLNYNADSTEAALTFNIKEKSKVKVQKVYLTGNVRVPAHDLVKKMRNRKRGLFRSSDFAQEKYSDDLDKIIEEYKKKGFLDAYVVSDSTHIDTSTNRMKIYIQVYEGPEYYFGDTKFVDNEKFTSDQLRKQLEFNEGDVFNNDKYEESIMNLYSAYHDIGHLHASINDERETRADSVLDITYDINEGLPSKVHEVKIVGNVKTKDRVIRRELSVYPGAIYNRSLLIRSVRDAMALNFFDEVVPDLIELPNGDVDVEFTVKEKQTAQISAGAGFNSQDKVVGNVGMGIPNFRGLGQNLSFNVEFGSRLSSFSLSFTEPWLFGHPTILGLNAFVLNRRWYEDYTEGRQGGSVRLGRRLRWPDNYFRVYASYGLERSRYFDFDNTFAQSQSSKRTDYYVYETVTDTGTVDTTVQSFVTLGNPYPGSILEFEQWQTASRMTFTITRDSRNLPEFATSGSDISYTLETTGGILGGYWHYLKHQIEAAKFFPLPLGMAFAAKVEYGVLTSPAGDDKIWVSDRFTPGGVAYDGIVRGYDDGSLTPDTVVTLTDTVRWFSQNPDQQPSADSTTYTTTTFKTKVRGKYMLVGNFEIQIPVVQRQIYGLLFYDAGNSWLHRNDIKLSDLHKGYGVGFRVVIPGMGTLGFDFAYPVDPLEGQSQKWKPHFQFGTTFR